MKVQEVILRAMARRIIPRGGTGGGDHRHIGPEYAASRRVYQPAPRAWEYAPGAAVRRLNTRGCLDYQQRRYFVCEVLVGERVCLENLGDKVLVRYRHMYVREIDTLSGRTTAVILPAPHPPL